MQGSAGISAWEDRAKELGLVMSGETAESAHQFSVLWGDMQKVMAASVRAIGAALLPAMQPLVDSVIRGSAAVRDFIKDNGGLIVAAFQVTGAIVAGGVALAAFSFVLRSIATGIGVLLVPLKLLSSLAAGLASLLVPLLSGAATVVSALLSGAATVLSGAFSAAASIAGFAFTTIMAATSAVVSGLWTAGAAIVSGAWTAGAWLVQAAWVGLQAVAGLAMAAWTAGAAAVSAAWTAAAMAIDVAMTFAATGAMALPALIVGAIAVGLSIAAAEIIFQLQRAFSRGGKAASASLPAAAADAGKAAGSAASAGFVDTITSGIGGVVSTVSSWAGAALGGLGAIVSGAASAFGSVIDWLMGAFQGLVADASTAFGGIADALAAGNIALAAKVLWALLKLEWTKGVAFISGLWDSFKAFWSDAVIGLAMIFTNAVAKVKTMWAEMIGWMQKKWEGFKVSGFTETLASWFVPIFAKMQGVSVEEAQKALKQDMEIGRRRQTGRDAAIDAETAARKAEIERERKGAEDALTQDKLAKDKARANQVNTAQADVDAARKELDDDAAEARAAREAGGKEGAQRREKLGKFDIPEITAGAGSIKDAAVGTFSGAALAGLGGTSVQEKMESHLANIVESSAETASQLGELTDALGEGLTVG
jgi:hypothetical protein